MSVRRSFWGLGFEQMFVLERQIKTTQMNMN